ncbi:unnamed protein product [Brassica rapa subsp. trilocularis]
MKETRATRSKLYQNQNCFCSRRSERYFRRGAKLDWPEGAASRDSLKAVWKLPRLPLIMQHVDHSAGDDPTKCSL